MKKLFRALRACGACLLLLCLSPAVFAQGPPPDFGHGLAVVYAVWIGVVVALYPICSWYAGVKARSRSRLLSYL